MFGVVDNEFEGFLVVVFIGELENVNFCGDDGWRIYMMWGFFWGFGDCVLILFFLVVCGLDFW